jgi:hypothetical protein
MSIFELHVAAIAYTTKRYNNQSAKNRPSHEPREKNLAAVSLGNLAASKAGKLRADKLSKKHL